MGGPAIEIYRPPSGPERPRRRGSLAIPRVDSPWTIRYLELTGGSCACVIKLCFNIGRPPHYDEMPEWRISVMNTSILSAGTA